MIISKKNTNFAQLFKARQRYVFELVYLFLMYF